MGGVLFFGLLLCLFAVLVGPIVGIIGLFTKTPKVAAGGFIAAGAGIMLALVIGVLSVVVTANEPQPEITNDYAPSESLVPSPR